MKIDSYFLLKLTFAENFWFLFNKILTSNYLKCVVRWPRSVNIFCSSFTGPY